MQIPVDRWVWVQCLSFRVHVRIARSRTCAPSLFSSASVLCRRTRGLCDCAARPLLRRRGHLLLRRQLLRREQLQLRVRHMREVSVSKRFQSSTSPSTLIPTPSCPSLESPPLEVFRFSLALVVLLSANRNGRGAFSKRSPKKANGSADADAAPASSNVHANGIVSGEQPNEQPATGSKASYSFRPRESVYLEGYVRLTVTFIASTDLFLLFLYSLLFAWV